jgi:ATP phosphoribosyltransferase regulatory subunit
MTAPVARIVTTRMMNMPEPIRLFYVSNVFRHSQSNIERGREFWQAGVELVGCNTSEADGEILSLLILSLREVGLKEVRIDVGHASLLKDLLKATGLDDEQKSILQSLLAYRDLERLENFMDQKNLPRKLGEAFLQFSCCRRLDEIAAVSIDLSEYGKASDHLKNIVEVGEVLADYGIGNSVFFDFSLTRKIEYYTGMVFEASVPNLGLPLGGGGRYDDFIGKFGKLKLPATGFALEIERCLRALTAQGYQIQKKKRTKILVSSKFRNMARKAANTLRDAGFVTLLDVMHNDVEKIRNYAKLSGIDYLVFVDSSIDKPATVYAIRSDSSRTVMIETLLQQIEG